MKRARQINDQVFNQDDMWSFLENTSLRAAGW